MDVSQFSRRGHAATAIHPVPSVIASQLSARGKAIALGIGMMSTGYGLVIEASDWNRKCTLMNANGDYQGSFAVQNSCLLTAIKDSGKTRSLNLEFAIAGER